MATRKFSNSSIKTGKKAISFTGEPVIPTDAADSYHSNLKIWVRGGYNGAAAGNISSGSGTLDIPIWGSSASSMSTISTVERIDSSATSSPVNSATNTFIKDKNAGITSQLQNDKLAIHFNGSSNPTVYKALDTSTWNTSTTNRTFAYWIKIDNVSANTSSNVITPTWHSWGAGNANTVDLYAHDWYTNGTGRPFMTLYATAADKGTFYLPPQVGTTNSKGVWFHFAVVHTSTSTRLFFNGAEVESPYTAVASWSTPGSSQMLSLNSRADGTNAGLPRNYTTGSTCVKSLADMRYYDTNLSAAAINAIYQKSKVYYN
jgi:hypothetical protein